MAAAGTGKVAITIEAWLNDRNDWQRRAASEFLANRRPPTDGEIAALADHCLHEAERQLDEESPPLLDGSVEAVPQGGEIRLKSVSHVRGVNALRSDAFLDLDQGNLTIIYGPNGSGKTGYSRLLKELCGARAKDDRLYPNVYSDNDVPPEAAVVISVDEKARPTLNWKAADGPITGLPSTVQVFDTAAATLFTDQSNPATHEPRTMRFLSGLITIFDRVAAELRQRKEHIVSQLPVLPPEYLNTPAAQFFEKVAEHAKADEILRTCALPENIEQEIIELEAALAAEDPAGKIAVLSSTLQRHADLRVICDRLSNGLSDKSIWAHVALRKNAETKRTAATVFAKQFFEGVPLAGVGEAVWRELWAHAKDYSEEIAYVGHSYPVLGDKSRCVLCQQELSGDAKALMKSFTEYLEGALETNAMAAEKMLHDAVAAFAQAPDVTFWPLVESSTGLPIEALIPIQNSLAARLEATEKSEEPVNLPGLEFSLVLDALKSADEQIVRGRDALTAVAGAQGRDEKKARLTALKAHKWLASIQQRMLDESDRQATLKLMDGALGLTVTNSLTKKNGEIANAYMVDGYQDRFNAELTILGGSGLPVKLNAKPEGKGRFSFNLELQGTKTKAAPRVVLSEGEQRVVALASFLADVTGGARPAPVIFDDPISSLDQDFEENVAARLVDLSQSRQLIVFTHRLSMIALLENAAAKLIEFGHPTKVAVQVIARTPDGAGVVSKIDIFSQKPKAGLHNLIQSIDGLVQVPEDLEPFARVGLCGTFRLFLEKIVEFHLCADVVARYRREVHTKNKIAKLALVTPADCELIDEMMSRYSGFVHSQAQEAPGKLPSAQALREDVMSVKTWLEAFDQRVKQAFPVK